MDQNQTEPTFEDSIKQVMQTLPPPIRHYIAQGKPSVVAKNLMAAYGLHIDQVSILEREILLLLMGVDNPEEFVQSLRDEAKMDQQTINGITQNVNAQIFVPLRAEMVAGGAPQRPAPTPPIPAPTRVTMSAPVPPRPKVSAPSKIEWTPPAPTPTAPPVQKPAPNPFPSPWASPQSSVIQANPALPQRPMQQDYISKVPKYVPPKPAARPPVAATPTRTAAPTVHEATPIQRPPQAHSLGQTINIVINGSRMLEDHEEPHIEFRNSAARVSAPPPNLPGAMPPPLPKFVTPAPRAAAPIAPKQSVPPPPPRAPGADDPYREPVDGE